MNDTILLALHHENQERFEQIEQRLQILTVVVVLLAASGWGMAAITLIGR